MATTIYRGDECKFAINLTAEGFSMDTDDFDIEVVSPGKKLKGYKNVPAGETSTDVIIYSETTTIPPEEEGGEETTGKTWFCIVDTSTLTIGAIRAIATAHVPDAHANDGVRNVIAVEKLGNLVEP